MLLYLILALFVCNTVGIPYLRDLAQSHGVFMGSAANYGDLNSGDLNYSTILGQQYDIITPENAMKWQATEPQQGVFTFTQGDYIVNYAVQHKQQVRGHNLCWGEYNPTWLTNGNFNSQQLQQILQQHINTTCAHYKGKLYSWDVVNEAVSDSNPSYPNNYLKTNVWYPAVSNYIDLAFQWARQADPSAKLFYNDYSAEGSGAKSNAVYNMVASMKSRGIPIDGVGLQYHVSLGYAPNPSDVAANIQRLSALGLEVHITELDVSFSGGSGSEVQLQTAQGTVYSNVLKVCLAAPKCKSFETWGFTDKYTWLGSSEQPLPFDVNYQPKVAFNDMAAILQQ